MRITNDRQHHLARTRLARLHGVVQQLSEWRALEVGIKPELIAKRRTVLQKQVGQLDKSVLKYEAMKGNIGSSLYANSISELGDLVIDSRISRGLSQKQFAELLGFKEQQVQRYESESYRTASLERLSYIASVLGVEMSISAQHSQSISTPAADVSREPVDWEPHLLEQIARRLDTRIFMDGSALDKFIFESTGKTGPRLLHKQSVRAKGRTNYKALLAWEALVCAKARKVIDEVKGDVDLVGLDWIRDLAKISRKSNGPSIAKEFLLRSGIILVIEPHFEKTYLEGGVTILDGRFPVIGMTLRLDRLDNFWFVLFHEIGHALLHLDRQEHDSYFDDSDADNEDIREKEADDFARSALIPDEIWKSSLVRLTSSADAIRSFAEHFGVHEAVVAGRIRRERNDYTIFSELVGTGEVGRSLE